MKGEKREGMRSLKKKKNFDIEFKVLDTYLLVKLSFFEI